MKHRLTTVAAAALLSSATAAQGAGPGVYGEIRGGLSFLTDSDIDQLGTTSEISFDTGAVVEGAVGYGFGNNLRGEVALGYRSNDNDQLSAPGFLPLGVDGEVTALSLMANGYYDFQTGNPALHPFVGGGVGLARIDADVSALGVSIADDDDTVFAWQAIAGAGYDLSPNVAATVRYAYFATADPTFTDATGVPFDAEYSSHAIMVGLLYTF